MIPVRGRDGELSEHDDVPFVVFVTAFATPVAGQEPRPDAGRFEALLSCALRHGADARGGCERAAMFHLKWAHRLQCVYGSDCLYPE